jgi:hydrogenase nickel incorporation protein HypA/HybF
MHELSLVMSIIDIALDQASKAGAQKVEEIELEIGVLSTVELNAFEFAWQQGKKNTRLEHCSLKIDRIPGMALCLECDTEFPVTEVYEACPVCGKHLSQIVKGKELRVKSLVVI